MTAHDTRTYFDDYHGFAEHDFSSTRLLVFHGMSGSGKTTAIEHLCHHHPHFRDRRPRVFHLLGGMPQIGAPRGELIVLDDVRWFRQLRPLTSLLHRGNTVMVASHLKPCYYLPWRAWWPARMFGMDQDTAKIERWLARQHVPFTRPAVDAYCRQFGANYVDLETIMEFAPGASFDQALGHFTKFCRLHLAPNPERS